MVAQCISGVDVGVVSCASHAARGWLGLRVLPVIS